MGLFLFALRIFVQCISERFELMLEGLNLSHHPHAMRFPSETSWRIFGISSAIKTLLSHLPVNGSDFAGCASLTRVLVEHSAQCQCWFSLCSVLEMAGGPFVDCVAIDEMRDNYVESFMNCIFSECYCRRVRMLQSLPPSSLHSRTLSLWYSPRMFVPNNIGLFVLDCYGFCHY